MKPVTPYGKADDLAYQNERLVQALRRERAALAIERARIQAVEDVLDLYADHSYADPEMVTCDDCAETIRAAIRRALDGEQ